MDDASNPYEALSDAADELVADGGSQAAVKPRPSVSQRAIHGESRWQRGGRGDKVAEQTGQISCGMHQ